MGPNAHEGAVGEGQDVHGFKGIEDRRRQVWHACRLEMAPFHHLGLGIDFQQVN